MKIVYTLAALAFLATTANAADCWTVKGNWENASTKSCKIASGGGMKIKTPPQPEEPVCDHEGEEEAPKV